MSLSRISRDEMKDLLSAYAKENNMKVMEKDGVIITRHTSMAWLYGTDVHAIIDMVSKPGWNFYIEYSNADEKVQICVHESFIMKVL